MKCFFCKKDSLDLAEVKPGKLLCPKCRRALRRARRAEKKKRDFEAYYSALTHPEFRGLSGARK